jgi:hypothetical protein
MPVYTSDPKTFTVINNGVEQTVTVTFTGTYDVNQFGTFVRQQNLNIPCEVVNDPALLSQIQSELVSWTVGQIATFRDQIGLAGQTR